VILPTVPTRPSGAQPQSRYDDLLQTATQLFSELGYERTTVRIIADRLGIQSGSLYSHISGKEEVLKQIVLFVGADFIERIERARQETGTPVETLRAMCRSHLDVLHDHQEAVTVYFNEWQKLDEASRQEIIELRERYEQHFLDVVVAGVERGTFTAADPGDVVLTLLSGLNWTYKWYRRDGNRTPHEIADALLDVVLNGLLTKRVPAARRRGPDATTRQ
jgi:AcrR family transcriptional regulator